ncbi:alpha/beta hydrolase [Euzebya sp.]|uniref:alpha/beta hydrolase n=1 Tax=Euzebya sp. TaxID=1971409 RepID=UPI0035136CB5
MDLHPAVDASLAATARLGLRPYSELSPTEARAEYRRVMAARRGPDHRPMPVGAVDDLRIDLEGRALAARRYRPAAAVVAGRPTLPTVVFFHGGGWVIGDLDSHDDLCRRIAQVLPAVVLAVDYRLAPEHPFPDPVEDAVDATRWACAHVDDLGGDPDAVVVAGDSAGGALATVTARRARDAGTPAIAAQLLLYPVTDLTMSTRSYVEMASGYGLTAATMAWFLRHYDAPADDPDASPSAASDLSGLPPAVVSTASHDPLRDEGDAYAAALRAAGVPTTHLRHHGLVHAYALMEAVAPAIEATEADLRALADIFSGRGTPPPLEHVTLQGADT